MSVLHLQQRVRNKECGEIGARVYAVAALKNRLALLKGLNTELPAE